MQPRLSKGAIVELERRVDVMFDSLLTRLLGGSFTGKHLFVTVDPVFSLPGLFSAAVSSEGGTLDRDLVDNLAGVVKNLMDKQRSEAKAVTVRRIQGLLQDVKAGRIEPENFRTAIEAELTDTWGRLASNVERVVNTETQHSLTLGLKDGIEQMNAVRGIEDAVVVFIPKQDTALCDECRRTHLLGTTPRCWYHSEVSADYHQRGEDRPSWHLMHPHCRCSLATVLPGFGFDGAGRVTFIKDGWNELEYQRQAGGALGGVDERRRWGMAKSEVEVGQPLAKMAIADIPLGASLGSHPYRDDGRMADHFDYSHVLTPDQQAAGYHVTVEVVPQRGDLATKVRTPAAVVAHLTQGHSFDPRHREALAHVWGQFGSSREPHILSVDSDSEEGVFPKGQGLGRALYEAVYAHASKAHGATTVKGFGHSEDAGRVHDSLARRHGMEYVPEPHLTKRGAYQYTIKSEPVYHHGTPSGDLRGGTSGLHVGTRDAAEQALHARIGYPVEGTWDGTREYGKTLLAGQKTLRERGIYPTGYNSRAPEEDHLPTGEATFSDNTPVLPTHKPNILAVSIKGPMSNTPSKPHADYRANGMMASLIRRQLARRGFYYTNQGEDVGSVSATLPGPGHVEVLPPPKKK